MPRNSEALELAQIREMRGQYRKAMLKFLTDLQGNTNVEFRIEAFQVINDGIRVLSHLTKQEEILTQASILINL